ncbi:MAG: amidohydrolase family protein [bacterium]
MPQVIDLYLDLPPTPDQIVSLLTWFFLGEGAQSAKGYKYTFGAKMAEFVGSSLAEMDEVSAAGREAFAAFARRHAGAVCKTMPEFIRYLDEIGVAWGITSTSDHDNGKTAEIVAAYPKRLLGFAYIDPSRPVPAVRDLEYAIRELKLAAAYITAFRAGIPANDRRCYPVYAKAVELGIPVFIYSAMNLSGALPMDVGHPRCIDDVARDFPELKIMAAVCGYPWITEMVGIARRHPNLYLSTEILEPAEMAVPGKGFEMLLHFGGTELQDRICFASNWLLQGKLLAELIEQVRALPLPDTVKEKWLYHNAARFFERA